MNIFYLKKRFFIFLFFLLLGMLALQLLNRKSKPDPVFLLSEIQTASVNFRNGISQLVKKYFFLLDLREKNKELGKKNKELKARHQFFKETLKENERLKKLIYFSVNQAFDLLPAQITGTDFLSKNELLTINKGSSQGIKKFMGVLHPRGVVGYIFRTSPHSSQVISLLNPLSSLPARNRRSRITGLVESDKKDILLFKHLDKKNSQGNEYLKIGDALITIKSDQFPAGFLVGHILFLDDSSKNVHSMAYVEPAVRFHSLEEVLVVLNSQNPLSPKPNFKKKVNTSVNKDENNEHKN